MEEKAIINLKLLDYKKEEEKITVTDYNDLICVYNVLQSGYVERGKEITHLKSIIIRMAKELYK